jgi:hypothetical protein
LEGWPSGLRRTPGKRVGVNASQGFESLPLRHEYNFLMSYYVINLRIHGKLLTKALQAISL